MGRTTSLSPIVSKCANAARSGGEMCVETPGTKLGSPMSASVGATLKSPVSAIGAPGFAAIHACTSSASAFSQRSL